MNKVVPRPLSFAMSFSERFFFNELYYKLRDKERSKESAYVWVGFLARSFVSFVSRIVRYALSSTDKSSSLSNQYSTPPNF